MRRNPSPNVFYANAEGHWKSIIYLAEQTGSGQKKYGLTVHLCKTCHTDNKKGVHADANKAEKLHKIGQAAFERTHTRQEFFNIFGRYYLDKEDEQEETVSEPEKDGFFFLPDDDL